MWFKTETSKDTRRRVSIVDFKEKKWSKAERGRPKADRAKRLYFSQWTKIKYKVLKNKARPIFLKKIWPILIDPFFFTVKMFWMQVNGN